MVYLAAFLVMAIPSFVSGCVTMLAMRWARHLGPGWRVTLLFLAFVVLATAPPALMAPWVLVWISDPEPAYPFLAALAILGGMLVGTTLGTVGIRDGWLLPERPTATAGGFRQRIYLRAHWLFREH